jgi:DNA-directed RNA polymerase subunit RPC12/RpoP
MKLGLRCTTCGEHVSRTDLIECDECGQQLHADCAEWEQTYECKRCGTETAIGALEF